MLNIASKKDLSELSRMIADALKNTNDMTVIQDNALDILKKELQFLQQRVELLEFQLRKEK